MVYPRVNNFMKSSLQPGIDPEHLSFSSLFFYNFIKWERWEYVNKYWFSRIDNGFYYYILSPWLLFINASIIRMYSRVYFSWFSFQDSCQWTLFLQVLSLSYTVFIRGMDLSHLSFINASEGSSLVGFYGFNLRMSARVNQE